MLTMLFAYASLCDPHFDRRESAESRLTHLITTHPSLYGPRLADLVRAATCPEVRSRGMRVLAVYTHWRVTAYAPPAPCWPICDTFPVPCPVLPAFALEDVRDRHRWPVESSPHMPSHNSGGPWWPSYRLTTERRVREMIREGGTWDEADSLVLRMWQQEVRSRHDCGVVRWP